MAWPTPSVWPPTPSPVCSVPATPQMTHDLRRLRLYGLLERLSHTNAYVLTPDGIRVAHFYSTSTTVFQRPCSPPITPLLQSSFDEHFG